MSTETMPQIIPLSPDSGSATNGDIQPEQVTIVPVPRFNNLVRNMKVVRNITHATLTAYLPDPAVATGTAIVICPGGGFSCLPIEIEGEDVAHWLNVQGVAAFVLRYRLLPTAADDETFIGQMQRPDMVQIQTQTALAVMDGKRAMSLVRQRVAEWAIDPQRIGILGFSAGGVVSAAVAVQYDEYSRPNFAASIYSPGWQDFVLRADAPPLFLAFANDDPVLSLVSEGSMRLYSAWLAAGHPVELHIYSKGGHGFGMAHQGIPCDQWIDRFADWLQLQGFPVRTFAKT